MTSSLFHHPNYYYYYYHHYDQGHQDLSCPKLVCDMQYVPLILTITADAHNVSTWLDRSIKRPKGCSISHPGLLDLLPTKNRSNMQYLSDLRGHPISNVQHSSLFPPQLLLQTHHLLACCDTIYNSQL